VSGLQAGLGRELLAAAGARLAGRRVGRIVELGCGTGVLTAALRGAWPEAELLANDLSPRMLALARRRLAGEAVEWLEGDAEAWLAGAPGRPVDLLIANAAVQWFNDPVAAVSRARTRLAPGGVLAVSTFGPDTFRELRTAFTAAAAALGRAAPEATLPFPDVRDWRRALGEDATVSEQREIRHYTGLRDFLHHLRELGATLPAARAGAFGRAFLEAAEGCYPGRLADGRILATWHCLQLVVQRPVASG
jgi:malonyl-CoA O-methyltransferase